MNRGLSVLTSYMLLVLIFASFIFFALPACLFSKPILLLAHQTEEVAYKASIYTKSMFGTVLRGVLK